MSKLSVLLLGLLLTSFTTYTNANTEINQSEIDAITAECSQEAKGAVDESIYAENCVEEKLQALKEQAAQDSKEKS